LQSYSLVSPVDEVGENTPDLANSRKRKKQYSFCVVIVVRRYVPGGASSPHTVTVHNHDALDVCRTPPSGSWWTKCGVRYYAIQTERQQRCVQLLSGVTRFCVCEMHRRSGHCVSAQRVQRQSRAWRMRVESKLISPGMLWRRGAMARVAGDGKRGQRVYYCDVRRGRCACYCRQCVGSRGCSNARPPCVTVTLAFVRLIVSLPLAGTLSAVRHGPT